MNLGNEFKKYSTQHLGIQTTTMEAVVKGQMENMTPYIIEERHMNVTQMDVFSRLMADRIIWLGTGINSEVANIVQAQMLFLQSMDKSKDVTMYINSGGGGVYAGLGIYDTMNLISPDVATVNTGMCASMAAVLLASGKKGKRSALKHSRYMIHQISGGAQGVSSDMEINLREMLELKKDLYDILSDSSGQSYETIEKWCDRDKWMRSSEAKEHGFIDEVL